MKPDTLFAEIVKLQLENHLMNQKVQMLTDSYNYTSNLLLTVFGLFATIVISVQIWNIFATRRSSEGSIQKGITDLKETLFNQIRSDVIENLQRKLSSDMQVHSNAISDLKRSNNQLTLDVIKARLRTHNEFKFMGELPLYIELLRESTEQNNYIECEHALDSLLVQYDHIKVGESFDREILEIISNFKDNVRLKNLVEKLILKISNSTY